MKHSIKRVQSQAGLSFAEREDVRPKVKQKLLFLLVLLLTAVTGAMAEPITVTWTSSDGSFDNRVSYSEGPNQEMVAEDGEGNPIFEWGLWRYGTFTTSLGHFTKIEISGGWVGIEGSPGWNGRTWTGNASSVYMANRVTSNMGNDNFTITFTIEPAPAASTYSVTLKDDTEDADKWSVKVGEDAAAFPVEGLNGGETVTVTYSGEKKVKSVKAVKKAAAPSGPDGAINGKFSVSDTKQVYFSKGNLRYASSKWSFFDNQYDYNNSYSADAWDHFGWSTSATDYGKNTSTSNSDFSGDFVDWGATMGAGWRTLSKDEWAYLFNTRSASTVGDTENGRYAKAKVNNVQGVILFPDTYTHPDGVTAPVGVNADGDTGWNGNSYTAEDWTKMESAGCVFLPAAGYRVGTSMNDPDTYGYYWTATPYDTNKAYRMYFSSSSLSSAGNRGRYYGCSVRLVREVTE